MNICSLANCSLCLKVQHFVGCEVSDEVLLQVLTTQWVEGEKLSESRSDDLLPLISTALNCYLVQLLESGFLHADPHPGNLLRTPDGRLCVLDFGLMTQVIRKAFFFASVHLSFVLCSTFLPNWKLAWECPLGRIKNWQ